MPKGKRFSEDERKYFRELVISKSEIVECKKSDCVSLIKKKETWEKITEDFKTTAKTSRTTDQLKRLWDNIKTKRKAELAADRREIFKTGGGPPPNVSLPDPELDSLGVDSRIKNAIDSDSFVTLEEGRNFYVVDGTPVFQPITNLNEKIKEDVAIISPEKKENRNFTPPTMFKNGHFQRYKRKPAEEFSAEAAARLTRSKYLLDLDRKIGAFRAKEAEINLQIAQEKLDYIKAKKAKLCDKE